MKVTLLRLSLLILSWHLSAGVSAPAANPDPKTQAQQLLDLSERQNSKNHDLALQTAQEALALFQSINDQEGIAESYLDLGTYYFAQNKMTEASQNFESALEIRHQRQEPDEEAKVLIQLGFVEARKGEWVNGFSYLTQAQNLLDDEDEPDQLARIAAGMAYIFNESGLPEYGLTQNQRAQHYFAQASNLRGYNRQIMKTGYTYFLLKKYPEALRELEQALEYFKSSGNSAANLDIAECEEYIGQVYLATEKYDLALQYFLPIPPFYETTHNDSDAAQVRGLIGEVYQRQGKIERARRNYDAAENYLKESIESTENIWSDLSSRTLAMAFSASVHDRYETYIECLMQKRKRQPSQGLEQQAFEASELARARSLAALLRDTQTTVVTGIDPRLAEREGKLRRNIREIAEHTISVLATDYKKEQLDSLEKALTALREQHQQLTQQLQKQNPNYDQFQETANYSIQQIQQFIVDDNETMLLEYFLGKDASYVWAITRNDARVYELPKAEKVTAAVGTLYELLAKKPDDDSEKRLSKAGSELAQMILTPLANQSTIKRVIVVADGAS